MIDTMRAFVALNLEIPAARKVADIARRLRGIPNTPRAGWISPTRYHVTLRFMGDIDVGLAPALDDTLRQVVSGCVMPVVHLRKIEAFPSLEAARVLFVGVEDDGAVAAISGRLNAALGELGFEPPSRPLVLHVTLARLRESTDVRGWISSLGTVDLGRCRMTECVLYRSDDARPSEEYPSLTRLGFLPISKKSMRPALRNPG